VSATVDQVQQAIDDADKLAEAVAIINRRYPHTRPDFLDAICDELMNLSRALRRQARQAVAR
jgi:hypothetical protein